MRFILHSKRNTHNVIDLFLKNPAGTIVASSTTTNGIFEKVKYVSSAVDQGVWQIEMRGRNVQTSSQPVYIAAYLIP